MDNINQQINNICEALIDDELKNNILMEYDVAYECRYESKIVEVTHDGVLALKCQTSDVGKVIKSALQHGHKIVGFSLLGCKSEINMFASDDDEIIVKILKGE